MLYLKVSTAQVRPLAEDLPVPEEETQPPSARTRTIASQPSR